MENIDWSNLGFGYSKTAVNVRCYWRDGEWQEPFLTDDENISMHMSATCLHYGQAGFEGMKAYRGVDGKIRLFRVKDNAERMQSTGDYLLMQAPPTELFAQMVEMVVKANEDYLPPYGTGATLYIRPFLIGTGAQIGVHPSKEYLFTIFVMPVGPYFKSGFNPIKVVVDREHDRAAPLGTGHIKAAGNYGASMLSGEIGHKAGYDSVLYLDAKEKRYIDECGAANFFAIKDGEYITPKSHSILPSITNRSLMQLAEDMGLKVNCRAIDFSELSGFEEAGACGTAAVISPIGEIYDPVNDKTISYGDKAGAVSVKLYDKLHAIQYGEEADPYGWVTVL